MTPPNAPDRPPLSTVRFARLPDAKSESNAAFDCDPDGLPVPVGPETPAGYFGVHHALVRWMRAGRVTASYQNASGFVVPMTKTQILTLFHEVFPDSDYPGEDPIRMAARSFAQFMVDDGLWALVGRHGAITASVSKPVSLSEANERVKKSLPPDAVQIIGIDCATKPKLHGLARGYWDGRIARVLDARSPGKDTTEAIVSSWIREHSGKTLLALDAPLGWPKPLHTMLAQHKAGEALNATANELFQRHTDGEVFVHHGKRPLDVGADRIARTAHAALAMLGAIRQATGESIPLAWERDDLPAVSVIEVYPAATLKARAVEGIRKDAWKEWTAASGAAPATQSPATGVLHKLRDALVVEGGGDAIDRNSDIFDAALCVLAGADFLAGECAKPADRALAETEGWIWVKRPPQIEGVKL